MPGGALEVLDIITGILGSSVAAVYLHGSAVRGGLRKDSDVDILAVVECDLADETRRLLTDRLLKTSGQIGNRDGLRCLEVTVVKLSDIVPWRYPAKIQFQYGEWLREGFEAGLIQETYDDPDLAIILSQINQHSVALIGDDAYSMLDQVPRADLHEAIADSLSSLMAGINGDERNVILTLARMWATVESGVFLPKDKAAEWAGSFVTKEQRVLLELAASAYRGECTDDWSGIDDQLRELAAVMEGEIKSRVCCGK